MLVARRSSDSSSLPAEVSRREQDDEVLRRERDDEVLGREEIDEVLRLGQDDWQNESARFVAVSPFEASLVQCH